MSAKFVFRKVCVLSNPASREQTIKALTDGCVVTVHHYKTCRVVNSLWSVSYTHLRQCRLTRSESNREIRNHMEINTDILETTDYNDG